MHLEKKVLNEIYRRITHVYVNSTIYLFGSYAYGSPGPHSDIDIAVILQNVHSKVNEANRIYEILLDIPYPKDVVIGSEQEFDFYKTKAGSIYRTIAEKGLLLNDSIS